MCMYFEAVELCPHCGRENIYPMYDPEKSGWVTTCNHCGKEILLCDECLHSEGNEERKCSWCCTDFGGKCFRGETRD